MAMVLTPSRLRVTQAKFFGDYNAGGSGVTSLASGQGIDLTPDPIVNTGTIALITPVTPTHGGTGSDMSATGGAGQYVKQVGVGANFTVGTIPYTDVSAGYVRINGTTPLTADWPAGAWKISSSRYSGLLLDINTTAPSAKAQFQYATTDTLDLSGIHPGVRIFAVADGSAAAPVTVAESTTFHQRTDASDLRGHNLGSFFYLSRKVGGFGGMQGVFSLIDGVGGDPTEVGGSGYIGITSYNIVDPGAPPATGITNYAYWGVATRYHASCRAVGAELDCINSAGIDAHWSASVANDPAASVDSTIGLAINGNGGNKNSVGITFQCPADSAWGTGIYFPATSIGTYAIDTGSMAATKFPLRIAHGAAIVARDAGDTADYALIRAKGTTNVAVGSLAGAGNTTGTANTAVGNQALLATTTSSNNTGVGSNALLGNIGGQSNTAVGSAALIANTSGNYNTAVGMSSLAHVTTNTDNTAVGYNAAHATTSGAITAVGSNALAANTSGANNTALGYHALQTVTTSNYNTAVGAGALAAATGTGNTAVGNGASITNSTGQYNVSLGHEALRNNATGQLNIAIGSNAGQYETGSGAFYVNNQDRTNTAGDKTLSLLYGVMAAAAANQKLTVNGLFKLGVIPPAYANNAAALVGGLLAGDIYVVTASDPRQLAIVF
jgi:hypothetical protein